MGTLDPDMKKSETGSVLQCSIHLRNGLYYQVNESYETVRDTIETIMTNHKGGSHGFLEYRRLHAGIPMPCVMIRVSEIAAVA